MGQSIKIIIADRVYPVSVKHPNEEEGMRQAAKIINDLLRSYENNYAVNDKQDVLAMCALQFASKIEIEALNKKDEITSISTKISKLNDLLDKHL